MKPLLLFSVLQLLLTQAFAQTNRQSGSLSDLSFIEGHWKGTHEGTALEAFWTAPSGDNITGFIRMMKEGKLSLYELFGIEQTQEGPVVLVKHFKPGMIGVEEKEKADRYTFVEKGEGRAVFEKQGELLRVLYEKRSQDQFVIALGKQQDGKWAFKDLFVFNRVK